MILLCGICPVFNLRVYKYKQKSFTNVLGCFFYRYALCSFLILLTSVPFFNIISLLKTAYDDSCKIDGDI